MKNKKSATSSMILGVAFVWFTTHFGGGFASGAQGGFCPVCLHYRRSSDRVYSEYHRRCSAVLEKDL